MRDTRSPIRTTTGECVANGHVNSVGHCRGADPGKLPEETVEFTTGGRAIVTAAMANYPSLRASRTHTLD